MEGAKLEVQGIRFNTQHVALGKTRTVLLVICGAIPLLVHEEDCAPALRLELQSYTITTGHAWRMEMRWVTPKQTLCARWQQF